MMATMTKDAQGRDSATGSLSYADLRMEKIRRNQVLLAGLGLMDTAREISAAENQQKKRNSVANGSRKRITATEDVEPRSRRRSPRLQGETPSKKQLGDDSVAVDGDEDEEDNEEEYAFDASKVLQYTCYEEPGKRPEHGGANEKVTCLRPLGTDVTDSQLKRVYSMNFHASKPILACGGHGGRVAVFSSTFSKSKSDELLLSFKASKGWISGVRFVDDMDCGLLVSSNDGTVSLWDCTVQHSLMPKSVGDDFAPHNGSGIFDMDVHKTEVVTSSKDGSLCVSTLRSSSGSFAVRTRIDDAHAGVAKSVMFQPKSNGNLIVSGGNDSAVRVWDLRQSSQKRPAVDMSSSFGLVVNIVRWNPEVEHQVLSASFAPAMELHDIRNPSSPAVKLEGHVPLGTTRVSNIYQPVYLQSGTRIVASGGGSRNLTMFDASSGEVLSSGAVGWESGSLEPCSSDPSSSSSSTRVAVSHGMDISFFECA